MIEPTRDSSAATAPDAVVSAEKRWRKFIRWFSDGKIIVGLLVGALIGIGPLVDTVDRLQYSSASSEALHCNSPRIIFSLSSLVT
jgi:hypothetical protein